MVTPSLVAPKSGSPRNSGKASSKSRTAELKMLKSSPVMKPLMTPSPFPQPKRFSQPNRQRTTFAGRAIAVNNLQDFYSATLGFLDFGGDQTPGFVESRHPGLHVEGPNGAHLLPQQCLYFFPLPHGHGALRHGFLWTFGDGGVLPLDAAD